MWIKFGKLFWNVFEYAFEAARAKALLFPYIEVFYTLMVKNYLNTMVPI